VIQHYSYKFRLYPTSEQEVLLNKHFGCTRFIYNYFLDKKTKHYLEAKEKNLAKKSLNYNHCCLEFTQLKRKDETIWLNDVSHSTIQQTLKNLDSAFNRFFKKLAKYPNFKKKSGKNSFRTCDHPLIQVNKISIGHFREGILFDNHRPVEGKIKSVTISKTPSGKYWASVLTEREIEPLPTNSKVVGIDLGITTLATCSDGTTYPNIRPLKNLEVKLRRACQSYSRKQKGSKGKEKARVKRAKVYEKITNIRNDHLQKVTTKIVRENQTIILEDLNVEGMKKNRKLAKSISDVSLGAFSRMIEYKAKWYGRTVIKVSRWFPSSKTCSNCSYIKEDLTLSDRKWTCNRCNTCHNRDMNAAQNILVQGSNLLNRDCILNENRRNCGDSQLPAQC